MKLPYQVNAADTYPVRSPDGSQIIVCGHERGLLVIWRHPRVSPTSQKGSANGIPGKGTAKAGALGENATQLELPLGTAVHYLAFPLLPQISDVDSYYALSPVILQRKLVVALACADNSIRLLTLPLIPPSSQLLSSSRLQNDPTIGFAGRGTWGEELITIAASHQSLPRGVAIAFTTHSGTRQEDHDDETESEDEIYDVLVASHSADLSGMLLVHRIPLSENHLKLDTQPGQMDLWRLQPLASPATSIDFHVPRASNPSRRPRLLVAESSGAVRIFECSTARGPDRGRWTLSLYPPIPPTTPSSILSARWVMNGKAIVVLTSSGDFGIWNLSISPNNRSIPGNRPTPFAVTSHIGTLLSSNLPPKSSSSISNNSQRTLAPMTPGTRKVRQEALFSGSASPSTSTCGGISVKLTTSLAGEGDESLVIWHGESISVLPSLLSYWQSKHKGPGNPFTNSATGVIRELPPVATNGEFRIAVSAFPKSDSTSATSANQFGFLVTEERSLTILDAEMNGSEEQAARRTILPPQSNDGNPLTRLSDQSMLAQGTLGLDGLDRLLDGMREQEGKEAGLWSPTPGKTRKTVGFR